MGGTNLREASLSGIHFDRNRKSQRFDPNGANLSYESLDKANLFVASLVASSLPGTKASTARFVSQAQVDSADGDPDTELPEGIVRPAHWRS